MSQPASSYYSDSDDEAESELVTRLVQVSKQPPMTQLFPGDDPSLSMVSRTLRVLTHIFIAPFVQGMMYGLGEFLIKYLFRDYFLRRDIQRESIVKKGQVPTQYSWTRFFGKSSTEENKK